MVHVRMLLPLVGLPWWILRLVLGHVSLDGLCGLWEILGGIRVVQAWPRVKISCFDSVETGVLRGEAC